MYANSSSVTTVAHTGHFRPSPPTSFGEGIDKNSLWGGLNIQKRELCVKGILAHFSEKTLKCLKVFPEAGIIQSVTTASWLLVASRKILPGVNHGHGSFSFHPDNGAQQISSINFWINFS
jgi:hypothetical protein